MAAPLTPSRDAALPAEPGVRPGALSSLLEELMAPQAAPGSDWDEALRPGAVVGRFELVRELGRGGFGVVYEARDRTLGRSVAFKAVRLGGQARVREERLLREADAAARLTHPNIVTLYDVGHGEHGPYLVLELLRGRTLGERLAQGPIALREGVRIAVEVARGLAHAHAHGVVHRDLTPGNVFLCDDGQVKLLDLGMAHAFGVRKVEGGTPAYMAPEQWRGAPEDERTDVFALGVLLHRMLADELPFPDDGGRAVQGGRPAPALEVAEAPALGALVGRMLEHDPVRRPRDGGEVLAALVAFQQELARTPSTGKLGPVRARPAHRRRWRIAALVALGALLGAGIAVGVARRRPAQPPEAPSIAVLPFDDLSPQRDQGYFSDGLSEEILNALAHVDGLRVTGRTSSFAFKNRNEDLRSIGQKLHVGTVLEGSVRKAGSRVRVTAQVIDLADGYHLWSETFDRELTDIFAVQDEIARAVVAALQLKLLPGKTPATRRTADSEAYNHYLLGRQFYAQFSRDGFRRAVDAFEKALARDPRYAPAWAGLSIPLYYTAENAPRAEAEPVRQRALAAAEKALSLDPELAEAYSARSYLRGALRLDWAGARADMERAVTLDPGDATIQRRYAILLMTLGRWDEALAATQRAVSLDPLFPANWNALAELYICRGELAAARTALDRALEIAPDYAGGHAMEGIISLLQGDTAAARRAFAQEPEELYRLSGAAMVEHTAGNAVASQQALDALTARFGEVSAMMVAGVHVWRGELDQAFAWLDRAYAQHEDLTGLVHDPMASRLRADPRYAALLRRLNLPVPGQP